MERKKLVISARYEALLLSREWSFRFLTLLFMIGVVYWHLTFQSNAFREVSWGNIALPSAIPYTNACWIYFAQLFFALFLAGRFLFEKRTSSTMDSIRVRSYTNGEQWWGRVFGFGIVISFVNMVFILEALFIHLFASNSPFSLGPYLFYLLTLTLPAGIFIIGLTLLVKSIVHHQALSIIILGILFYLNVTYTPHILHGTLDILASMLPNSFSEWTGFSGLNNYLLQRLAFLLTGIGLLCWGRHLQRRLDDHPTINKNPLIWGAACIIMGIWFSGKYYHSFEKRQREREMARTLFVKYENRLKAEVTNHRICFQQTGETFSAESHLTLTNPHEEVLSSVILYLNPGLTVKEVRSGNHPIHFHREGQILLLEQPLSAKDSLNVQLHYTGGLTGAVCYAEFTTLPDTRCFRYFRYGQELFFLQEHFTLLTPEILWYPVSQPTVHVQSGQTTPKNFTRFTLEVIGENNRIVISQGTPASSGDTLRFTNRYPLTGLSLCMGRDYIQYTDTLGSVRTELYLFRGHEWYFQEVMNWKQVKQFINRQLNGYPFDKLALVEIPAHFAWYSREWTDQVEVLQPELIFRTEREAMMTKSPTFDSAKFTYDTYNRRSIPNPEGKWISDYNNMFLSAKRPIFTRHPKDILTTHLQWTIIKNRKIYPFNTRTKYEKSTSIRQLKTLPIPPLTSYEFERIDRILSSLYLNLTDHLRYEDVSVGNKKENNKNDIDYLNKHSLMEALQNPQLDVEQCLKIKSIELAKRIALVVPIAQFNRFLVNYKEKNIFSKASFEDFCREFQATKGIDILPLVREWYHERGVPTYQVSEVKHFTTKDENERPLLLSTFTIWNQGNCDGIIYASMGNDKPQAFRIPANSVQEIRTTSTKRVQDVNGYMIRLGLSLNFPATLDLEIPAHLEKTELLPVGIFDADTTIFSTPVNEFIVEDNSEGFRLINTSKIKQLVQEKEKLEQKDPGWYPPTWSLYTHGEAHGNNIRTYYCKLSRTGEHPIEWHVKLPETGEYELYIYTNYRFFKTCWTSGFTAGLLPEWKKELEGYAKNAAKIFPVQTYVFTHEKGEEKVDIEIDRSGDGWVSLGKYHFSKGKNKLTLLDKGAYVGQYLYADAVKWVRIK